MTKRKKPKAEDEFQNPLKKLVGVWQDRLVGLARPASAVRLALCGHLAVVLRAVPSGGDGAALMTERNGGSGRILD
jgi:hypothetical protein